MKNHLTKRVVITGIGPVTSIGIGKNNLWNSVLNKRTNLTNYKYLIDSEEYGNFWLHKINNFDLTKIIVEDNKLQNIRDLLKIGNYDKDLFYLIAATELAIEDSNLTYDKLNNDIGLFLTSEHPGFETFCEKLILQTLAYSKKLYSLKNPNISKIKLLKHLFRIYSVGGYNLQTFMYLHLIAKVFDLHGFSLFTNNACASGLFALEAAAKQIKSGGSKIAIVASSEYPVNIYKYLWFKERKLYSKGGKIKPFDVNANGIVFGDGASAIVLEELEHALHRNANIYAEYLGGGFHLEGWKVTIPDITSDSYYSAIKKALENAKVTPSEIDLINPHGAGIKVVDSYEVMAINKIFLKKYSQPYVTAFKPLIGHCLGNSALAELIILFLSLNNNLIPATLNTKNIDFKINLVTKNTKAELKTVMKLSCGFAGFNGATIFRTPEV